MFTAALVALLLDGSFTVPNNVPMCVKMDLVRRKVACLADDERNIKELLVKLAATEYIQTHLDYKYR